MRDQRERAAPWARGEEQTPRAQRASGTHRRVRLEDDTAAASERAPMSHPRPVLVGVSPSRGTAASQTDATAFAAAVLGVARDVAEGADRALIEHVWRAGFDEAPLDDFKQRLFATHKRGLLVLGRADLRAHRYPRAELDASEIARSSLRFHFIRTDLPERAPR
jgi:hypothetical protein